MGDKDGLHVTVKLKKMTFSVKESDLLYHYYSRPPQDLEISEVTPPTVEQQSPNRQRRDSHRHRII